jgi:hypothetical protein
MKHLKLTIMERKFQTNYGEVTVKDCMIDLDGTNLEEGISIRSTDCEISLEIVGKTSDEMDTEILEHLIECELS